MARKQCWACGQTGGFACPECNDHGGERVCARRGHAPRDHDSYGADYVRSLIVRARSGGTYRRFSDDDLDWEPGTEELGARTGRCKVRMDDGHPGSM